jgi:hypothetical protein
LLFFAKTLSSLSAMGTVTPVCLTWASIGIGVSKAFASLIAETFCPVVLFAFPWLVECWTFFHIY